MAFTEDFSPFFADFGDLVSLDGGAPVRAIFDKAYAQHEVGEVGIATSSPALTLPSADVPANPVGKSALVLGVTYSIVDARPDGTGVSVLILERSA